MKKLLPIIVVAVLVLGGGGFFAFKTFMGGGPSVTPAQAQKKAHDEARKLMKKRKKERVDGPTVPLGEEFVVNLADQGLAHFAKFALSFKVDVQTPLAAAGHAAGAEPALHDQTEIRDIVIDEASRFTAGELVSDSGRERFKKQLMVKVADHTETLPLGVYFTSFAVQ
jgi:flagellar protein FliL